MGRDYNMVEVHNVDPVTGFPRDQWGHLLDADNGPEDGWKTGWKGMKLPELTYPYGSLSYAVGSSDDFYCFASAIIRGFGPNGERAGDYLVLHSVLNSETGHFIQDGSYEVIPMANYRRQEMDFVYEALDWCGDNEVRHNKTGWNQDPYFFVRDVYLDVLETTGQQIPRAFSRRERRVGGKRIDKFCGVDL